MAIKPPQRHTFRPMLSATYDPDGEPLTFPVMASPKVDGFRCLTPNRNYGIHDTSTRKLLPIPNTYTRYMTREFQNLDGEIVVGAPNDPSTYDRTKSLLTRHDGQPDLRLWVFDITEKPDFDYVQRYLLMLQMARDWPEYIKPLETFKVTCFADLQTYLNDCLSRGYEGIMTRTMKSPYKWGRSTLNESYLVKHKALERAVVEIIGFEEAMTNANELTEDALGLAKRSASLAGKIPLGTLGAFICQAPEWPGVTFNCGTGEGLTKELRQHIWNHRADFLRKKFWMEFQAIGSKERPRNPSWKGFWTLEDANFS